MRRTSNRLALHVYNVPPIWLLSTSQTFSQDPPVTCYASVFFPFLNTKSQTSQAFPAMKLAVHLPRNCSSSPDLSLTKFFSSGSSLFKGHLWSRNPTVSDFHIHYLIFKSLMDVIFFFFCTAGYNSKTSSKICMDNCPDGGDWELVWVELCPLPKIMKNVKTPGPQNVILFGDRVWTEQQYTYTHTHTHTRIFVVV